MVSNYVSESICIPVPSYFKKINSCEGNTFVSLLSHHETSILKVYDVISYVLQSALKKIVENSTNILPRNTVAHNALNHAKASGTPLLELSIRLTTNDHK